MVPRLKEVDSSFAHFVNQPMFLSYPSRPTSCQQILQRLRFPDATERISQHGFDQLEDAQRYLAVSFYPIAEILPKFRGGILPLVQRSAPRPISRRKASRDSGLPLRPAARRK